jgi:hypothetical protein
MEPIRDSEGFKEVIEIDQSSLDNLDANVELVCTTISNIMKE